MQTGTGCGGVLGGERTEEEVKEFKYSGTGLCKHGSREGEMREGESEQCGAGQVMGSLGRITKGRRLTLEVRRRGGLKIA